MHDTEVKKLPNLCHDCISWVSLLYLMALNAVSRVLSTTHPQYRNTPVTSWMNFLLALSRGDVFSCYAYWMLASYFGGLWRFGESCTLFGVKY